MIQVCHSNVLKEVTTFGKQPKIQEGGKISDTDALSALLKIKDLSPAHLKFVLEHSPTLGNIEDAANMRANIHTEAVLDEGMDEGVVDLIMAHGDFKEQVFEVFQKIVDISHDVRLAHPGYYQHHPLQSYMAALAALSEEQQTILLAEPAQGKSYVLFLLAEYALKN